MTIKKPIDLGIVDRVARGTPPAKIYSPSPDWFGPGEPAPPAAPESVKGRAWDYPVGYNLRVQPRAEEGIGFAQLRALAHNCDLVRLVIETRKDQLCKLSWVVKPKEGEEKNPAAERQAQDAAKLFKKPDRVRRWNQWLRMLLEDMFVIDAATIYPRPTLGGGLYSLDVIDGATIVPRLDETGRLPEPPGVAYQQVLKGVVAGDFTREQLIYFPRNPLSWRVYGLPPVEQIILTVNIVLRRQLHLLQFFTEGNLPDALLEVPEGWGTEQIKEWQQYWDALFSGNTAQRRKGTWVPKGMAPHYAKEADLKNPIDEWFARVVCYAFSVSPQPFITQINRATAETAQEMAMEEGLAPLQEWVKDGADEGLERGGYDLVEFAWEEEIATKPKEQAEIDEILGRTGIKRRREIRAERGLEDDGVPDFIITTSGTVLLDEIGKIPVISEQPPAASEQPLALAKAVAQPPPAADRKVPRIDRDRPEMVQARNDLAAVMLKAFKADAAPATAQLAEGLGLAKAEEDLAAKIDRLLRELKLAGIEATVEEVQAVLTRAAQNGGLAALVQINQEAPGITEQVNKLAVEWAKNRAAEMVTKIDESTREMLRADVTQAVEEGWSTGQLSKALEENFAFSESRSETIARTEIAKADVEGNLMAYRESGVVEGKESILGSEHALDDECDENAAEGAIPLDQAFSSGDMGPPYHPNCVCDVLPVLTAVSSEQ